MALKYLTSGNRNGKFWQDFPPSRVLKFRFKKNTTDLFIKRHFMLGAISKVYKCFILLELLCNSYFMMFSCHLVFYISQIKS